MMVGAMTTEHEPDDKMLSVPEVARRLGVSTDTVGRWIRNRELPAVRIGPQTKGRYRVRAGALRQFIERGETMP